jgi:hypothetical protein
MKKNYDFSKAEKNPYAEKLKGKKLILQPDVSIELADIVNKKKTQIANESELKKTVLSLEKRVKKLEQRIRK